MRKIILNILKYVVFLGIGVFIFWRIYHDDQLITSIKNALKSEVNYFWIVVSILFGILSQFSRAIRWKMLIKPLGYNPKLSNTFLSVLVLYFVNILLPRAGEIARCSVLDRTDKVPFTKLVGTVVVERLADFITLILLSIVVFATNISRIERFINENMNELNFDKLFQAKYLIIIVGVIVLVFMAFYLARKYIRKKYNQIKDNIIEGIKTIRKLDNVWLFIGHTAFIFLMWLLMLYVVFLAYGPTKHLSIFVGMFVFLMGGFAMLAPINAGIGPWHWMVYKTLTLYGITVGVGKTFAFIAHSTTNLVYLFIGFPAFIYLMIAYFLKKRKLSDA
jgi:glycosyltransferase 2 family protein